MPNRIPKCLGIYIIILDIMSSLTISPNKVTSYINHSIQKTSLLQIKRCEKKEKWVCITQTSFQLGSL